MSELPIAIRRMQREPYRVVESQHRNATRKLVDSDEEQALLEQVLEDSKPSTWKLDQKKGLHYLLFTPFRYPPLRHGSRFGTRFQPGIWYGAESLRTAFCETAYYRFVFLEGTSAKLRYIETSYSSFQAKVASASAVDLSREPYLEFQAQLTSPTHYEFTQAVGERFRNANVELIRYRSARDRNEGLNIAVLTPRAFTSTRPYNFMTWHSFCTSTEAEFSLETYMKKTHLKFSREEFLVEGKLPAPAP